MVTDALISIIATLLGIVVFMLVALRLVTVAVIVAVNQFYNWMHYNKIQWLLPGLTLVSILGTMFLLT